MLRGRPPVALFPDYLLERGFHGQFGMSWSPEGREILAPGAGKLELVIAAGDLRIEVRGDERRAVFERRPGCRSLLQQAHEPGAQQGGERAAGDGDHPVAPGVLASG